MTGTPKKLASKPASRAQAMVMKSSGKGKPVARKPAKPAPKVVAKAAPKAKAAAKPAPKAAAKPVARPVAKVAAKAAPKPAPKPVAKAAAKPAPKPLPKPSAKAPAKPAPKVPVLNKGALAALEAKKRREEEQRIQAEKAAAEASKNRVPRLVRATPEALQARTAAKAPPTKGGKAPKPAPEVRPIGVLPAGSMVTKPRGAGGHVVIPAATRPAASSSQRDKEEPALTAADLRYFEQRLQTEYARIAAELGHLEATVLTVDPREATGETGNPTAEAGSDSLGREVSFNIASQGGRHLREILDAMRRIVDGTYGICESSGKRIPRARLEALPWARYTVAEQEYIERQQRLGLRDKDEE
ncbi:MAG: TraR/DksA family transcriptional regulator [bacterium]